MASIVECVEVIKDKRGTLLNRFMFGPFKTFEEAHEWMTMRFAANRFDVCLIHTLNDAKTAFAEIRRKNADDAISKA